MDFKKESSLVLLGAGASKPAGLPLTTEISQHMANPPQNTILEPEDIGVIRFVIGALQMRKGVRNKDPFGDVNIERVFSAIQKLADRGRLRISPFVNSWHNSVSDIEPVERTDQSHESNYANAAVRMQRELTELLWCSEEKNDVSYLNPLVEFMSDKGGTVATLNYDNSIELAACNIGVDIDDGFDEWVRSGGRTDSFRNASLLKPHGSLNWVHNLSLDDYQYRPPISEPTKIQMHPGQSAGERRALIFGTENKLQADGPFLDIFQELKRRLENKSCLIVIGYSFNDGHINYIIDSWLESHDNGKIIVIGAPYSKLEDHRLKSDADDKFFENGSVVVDQVRFAGIGASRGISTLFG
jgi:hypothetical protein